MAVVSDIHAYLSTDGEAPSHLRVGMRDDEPSKNPVAGLLKLITDEGLSAEVVLSCGDMGDKAVPAATQYAWQQLHRISDALGATLYATAGNHDVDSRGQNDFDARGMLQGLSPTFPCADETLADKYWSRHYAIISNERCRLVLLNSAAYHGYQAQGELPEYVQGRVATSTLDRLFGELESHGPKINVLLCHHHPHRFDDLDPADLSEMKNGTDLIARLRRRREQWMIVHGHKHLPHLEYAGGDTNSPIILSAGSFSAVLGTLAPRARNQFYVVEFPVSRYEALDIPLGGTVTAWDWNTGLGWQRAEQASGLPYKSGFGCREHAISLAKKVAGFLRLSGRVSLTWPETVVEFPILEFLLPSDLDRVYDRLEDDGIKVLRDPHYGTELSAS